MTEAEWNASEDPAAMARWVTGGPALQSDRKLRLFACACCRRTPEGKRAEERWDHFLAAVSQLELSADVDPYASSQLIDTFIHPDWDAATLAGWAARDVPEAAALMREVAGNPFRPVELPTSLRCENCGGTRSEHVLCADRGCNGWMKERGPNWLTPQVLVLAQAAYDERPGRECPDCQDGKVRSKMGLRLGGGFKCKLCGGTGRIDDGTLDPLTLAALADALEEEGCPAEVEEVCRLCGGRGVVEDEIGTDWPCVKCSPGGKWAGTGGQKSPHPLPAHLRSPGPHVRGCWALDLILGKE